MKECPRCHNWTLEFDEYFGRFKCLDERCGWMAPSTAEREIRLLRSHAQPTTLDSVHIPKLGLVLTPSYEAESDVLSVDFGLNEPTFDLPDPDGRMIWRIGRHSDAVAGFSIAGVGKWAISGVTVEFITRRKGAIESRLRRIPMTLARGRATRELIEEVIVTAVADDPPVPMKDLRAEGDWNQVVRRVGELTQA